MSIFTKVRLKAPKHSTFNLSYDRKFSLGMGTLVPCHVQEIVPGDKIQLSTAQMLRFAPMISPVMHEVNVFVHYFFVPNRILWKNWEDFITGGESGLDAHLPPKLARLKVPRSSLADYLGLPVTDEQHNLAKPISALPFMAYQKIYNEYYRDQNLVEEVPTELPDGTSDAQTNPISQGLQVLRKRAWQHDYFTSCLPFAQKGNPVQLPIGDIQIDVNGNVIYNPDGKTLIKDTNGNVTPVLNNNLSTGSGNMIAQNVGRVNVDNTDNLQLDINANANSINTTTINDLRKAFRLQEWLEKNARAGSRYVESILAHFGVRSSDSRLQRPEFLGGGMSPVMISEVLQTSQTDVSPQGNMTGHGLNLGSNQGFNKFFEEHGYIIGIMSVMPKTAYQQGVPRHFRKFDKFDYFWPEFQHIGEQEVYNNELMAAIPGKTPGTYNPDGVFGYIPRYAEYKYNPSTVHGYFKDNLDFWHMGRIFDLNSPPVLNKEFIEANPTRRIFAIEDPSEDVLYCQMFHNIIAKRKMTYYSDPSFR